MSRIIKFSFIHHIYHHHPKIWCGWSARGQKLAKHQQRSHQFTFSHSFFFHKTSKNSWSRNKPPLFNENERRNILVSPTLTTHCSMIGRCKALHCIPSQSFYFTFKKSHKQSLSLYKEKPFPHTCIALSSLASAGTPEWNSGMIRYQNENYFVENKKKEEDEVKVGEEEATLGERTVQCEVEVISWRERRIKAEISVNADVGSVWNALTDYERLADFIPNLVSR